MTKNVKFDVNGRRSEINIQISALTTEGSVQIATWDSDYGIKSSPIPGVTTSGADVLRNRTFIVLISIVRKMPYIFWIWKINKFMNLLKVFTFCRHHLMECWKKQVSSSWLFWKILKWNFTLINFFILATQLLGNDRYEGFGVDIIHELSEILGFKYEFRVEKQYGNKDPITKKWNGMIRQLQDDVRDKLNFKYRNFSLNFIKHFYFIFST